MNYSKNTGYSKPKIPGLGTSSISYLKNYDKEQTNQDDLTNKGTDSTCSQHFSQNTLQTNSTIKHENIDLRLNSARNHNKNKSDLVNGRINTNLMAVKNTPKIDNQLGNFYINNTNNQNNNNNQYNFSRNQGYSQYTNNVQQPLVQYTTSNYLVYENDNSCYPEIVSDEYIFNNNIQQLQNQYNYNYPQYYENELYNQNTLKTNNFTSINNNRMTTQYNNEEERSLCESQNNYSPFIQQSTNYNLNQTSVNFNNPNPIRQRKSMFTAKSVNDLLPLSKVQPIPTNNVGFIPKNNIDNNVNIRNKCQNSYLNSIQRVPQYSQQTINSVKTNINVGKPTNKKPQLYLSKNISNLPNSYKIQGNIPKSTNYGFVKAPLNSIPQGVIKTINPVPSVNEVENNYAYNNNSKDLSDRNYQTLNKIDKNDLTLNVEDLLLHEEKLSEIIEELASNPGNPCYEWWVFFVSSSLSGRLENFYRDESCKKIITKHSVLEFITIILCYDCETYDVLNKTEVYFTQAFSYISNSLMLFCDYLLNKINNNNPKNIWVNKLKNLVKTKLKLAPNNKEENIKVILYNNENLVNLNRKILKEHPANAEYLELIEKFLEDSSTSTLLILSDIFRNKVLKFKNTNKSVIASALTQNLIITQKIEEIDINKELSKENITNSKTNVINDEISINTKVSEKDSKAPYVKNKLLRRNTVEHIDRKFVKSDLKQKDLDNKDNKEIKQVKKIISNIKPAEIEFNPSTIRKTSTKITNNLTLSNETAIKQEKTEKEVAISSDKELSNVLNTIESIQNKSIIDNGIEEHKIKTDNSINTKIENEGKKIQETKEIGIPETPYIKNIPLTKKYCLVLDLDETLVHFKIDSKIPNQGEIIIRPYLFEFLNQLSPFFELIMFTAATEEVSYLLFINKFFYIVWKFDLR